MTGLLLRLHALGDVVAIDLVEAEAALNARAVWNGEPAEFAFTRGFRLTPNASGLLYDLVAPFGAIGGWTLASVRFPIAILATASVPLIGFAYVLLYRERSGALAAMGFAAVLVGYVAYSRLCDQMPLIPFFASLQLVLYLCWRRTSSRLPLLLLSLVSGVGLSLHLIMAVTPVALLLFGGLLALPTPNARWRHPLMLGGCLCFFLLGLLPLGVANVQAGGLVTVGFLLWSRARNAERFTPFGLLRGCAMRAVAGARFLDGGLALRSFVGQIRVVPLPLATACLIFATFTLLRADDERGAAKAMLGWLFLSLVVMSASPTEYHLTHYLLFVVPVSLLVGRAAALRPTGRALLIVCLAWQLLSVSQGYFAAYRITGGCSHSQENQAPRLSGMEEVVQRIVERPEVRTVYAQSSYLYYPLRWLLPASIEVKYLPLVPETLGRPLRSSGCAFVTWADGPRPDPPSLPPQASNLLALTGRRLDIPMDAYLDHTRHYVRPRLLESLARFGESTRPSAVVRGPDGTPHFWIFY